MSVREGVGSEASEGYCERSLLDIFQFLSLAVCYYIKKDQRWGCRETREVL